MISKLSFWFFFTISCILLEVMQTWMTCSIPTDSNGLDTGLPVKHEDATGLDTETVPISLGPFTHELVMGGSVQSADDRTPHHRCSRDRSRIYPNTHNVEILLQRWDSGLSLRSGSSARTWRGWRHEAADFSPSSLCFMIPNRCGPAIDSRDGEHLTGRRRRDPAGCHLLMSRCHSGVRPLEQLQHKVSGRIGPRRMRLSAPTLERQ